MPDYQTIVAADVMKRGVLSVRPDQTLLAVERMLVENHVTGMPVMDAGKLVGIVSRSDIARVRVLIDDLDAQVSDQQRFVDTQADGFDHMSHSDFHGFGQRFNSYLAKDVMRSQVVTCNLDTPVTEVASMLVRNHIHRLVVVDNDRPVGIVSALDLAALIAKSAKPDAT